MRQLQIDRFWGHRWEINSKAKSSARENAYVLSPFSCIWLFVTPWTVACQAPLSMAFPRQEYSSGLPFLSPGDLPDPGIEPMSLKSLYWHVDSLPPALPEKPQQERCSTKVEFSAWIANLHSLEEWSVWHQDGDSVKDWGQLSNL